MDIQAYVRKNVEPFDAVPFNIVDSLIVAWMAYYDFAKVKDELPLTFKQIEAKPLFKKTEPYIGSFVPKYSRRFMHGLAISQRFSNAELLDYKCVLDKQNSAQFAVIAVRLARRIVIAFRGTDASYTGWREDFELSYKDTIVSYSLAKSFVNNIIEKHDEQIVLCGHSKGGNIATYLLSQIEDASRIERVYSFDGPGFRTQGLFKRKEDRLKKFTKIIPQSSLVGVLFSNETDVKIIRSRSFLVVQHLPIFWVIKNNDFIYLKKRTLSSRYLEKSLNAWIESLKDDERERFTQIVFDELDRLEAKDFVTFFKHLFGQIKPVYEAYLGLDKNDKKLLFRVAFKLARNMVIPEKNNNKVEQIELKKEEI